MHLLCVFVRYRENREYRRIKCCTKFAQKLHQHSTPIQLVNLESGEMLYSEREIYRQRIFVTIATKAFTMDHIALIGNNTAIYFKQLI